MKILRNSRVKISCGWISFLSLSLSLSLSLFFFLSFSLFLSLLLRLCLPRQVLDSARFVVFTKQVFFVPFLDVVSFWPIVGSNQGFQWTIGIDHHDGLLSKWFANQSVFFQSINKSLWRVKLPFLFFSLQNCFWEGRMKFADHYFRNHYLNISKSVSYFLSEWFKNKWLDG